jgi:hypothetical protein
MNGEITGYLVIASAHCLKINVESITVGAIAPSGQHPPYAEAMM